MRNNQKTRRLEGIGLMIMIATLICINQISLVSSAEWDNTKSYDSATKTITLSNWLGFGEDLAVYKMTDNTDNCGTDCYTEGTAVIYNPEKLFQSMRFEGDMIKSYKIKIGYDTETIHYKEPIYQQKCVSTITNNITKEETDECNDVVVGDKDAVKEQVIWEDYNGETLEAGTYYWRIEGTKEISDSIDWIGTVQGIEMTEWVWWIGITPSAYWKFNELDRGPAYDSSGNGLTAQNTTGIRYIAGKLNNCANNSYGNPDYFTVTDNINLTFGTNDWTIAFWIKTKQGDDNYLIQHSGQSWVDAGGYGMAYLNNGDSFQWGKTNHISIALSGAEGWFVSGVPTADDNWHRVVFTQKSGNWTAWVDNNNSRNLVYTGANRNNLSFNANLLIFQGNSKYFNGSIDDLQIFKGYAWSATDVTTDWNGGAGKEGETTPSYITIATALKSPSNNAIIVNVSTASFNSNSTITNGNLTNATLKVWLGGTLTFSNYTAISGLPTFTSTNLSISTFNNANYTWNVLYCGTNATGSLCSYAPANYSLNFSIAQTSIQLTTTLVRPADSFNTTTKNTIGFESTFIPAYSLMRNATLKIWNMSSFIKYTNYSAFTINSTNISISNMMDGSYKWNIYGCANNATGSLCAWGSSNRTFSINTFNTTIINPANNSYFNYTNINFTSNISSLSGLNYTNLTIYNSSGAIINQTITLWGGLLNGIIGLPVTLIDGAYTFITTAYDLVGNYIVSPIYNFVIDLISPSITIATPTGYLGLKTIPFNVSFNYTISDTNLQTCWYNLDGASSINISLCANITIAITNNTINHVLILNANDSAGNIQSETTTFYEIILNNVTYNSQATQGGTHVLILNITDSASFISANLIFNGTTYISTKTSDGMNTLFTNNIVPLSTGSKQFYWSITADSVVTNTSLYNMTVLSLGVDNCTTQSTVAFNFTTYDEDTKAILTTGVIEGGVITIYPYGTSTEPFLNVSSSGTSGNLLFCINVTQMGTSNFSAYYETKYYNGTAGTYSIEYKYGQMITLNNNTIPQVIPLYPLLASEATEFTINYRDRYLVPVESALIDIYRQYLPLNQYTSIETPKTDAQGNTYGHLIQTNQAYTIVVSKNGVILSTFDRVVAKCIGTTCEINLNEAGTTIPSSDWVNYGNLINTYTLDSPTRTMTMVWSTADGTVQTVGWTVYQMDGYLNKTVCTNSQTSSSGGFTCTVPNTYGNTTFVAIPIINGEYTESWRIFSIGPSVKEIYGNNRYIFALIMFSTLVLLFVSDPIWVLIGGLIGLLFSFFFLFAVGGWFGGSVAFVFFAFAVGIIIWRINKLQ